MARNPGLVSQKNLTEPAKLAKIGSAVKEKIPRFSTGGLSKRVPAAQSRDYRPTAEEARWRSLTLTTRVEGTPFALLP